MMPHVTVQDLFLVLTTVQMASRDKSIHLEDNYFTSEVKTWINGIPVFVTLHIIVVIFFLGETVLVDTNVTFFFLLNLIIEWVALWCK